MLPQMSIATDREPELLSPAGNWDCARAAVANGADAIFFGLHGVRGFVTMNTLVFTGEMAAAEQQLILLEKCGVDAIIVQDLGLARLCRHVAPSIEIHASTQMTITSPEGLAFADQLLRGLFRSVSNK